MGKESNTYSLNEYGMQSLLSTFSPLNVCDTSICLQSITDVKYIMHDTLWGQTCILNFSFGFLVGI